MTGIWRFFFVASAVLLGFLGLSAPYVEPGTATFTVAVLGLAMCLVMFVGSAAFIYADWDPFEGVLAGNGR